VQAGLFISVPGLRKVATLVLCILGPAQQPQDVRDTWHWWLAVGRVRLAGPCLRSLVAALQILEGLLLFQPERAQQPVVAPYLFEVQTQARLGQVEFWSLAAVVQVVETVAQSSLGQERLLLVAEV